MPDRSPFWLADAVRPDFPILARRVGEWPLTYLDSGNTSQKPRQVVDAIAAQYLEHNANVARAMHLLGAEATEAFEGGRAKVASFIGGRPEEIVFTKNASEALNLAAHALGQHLKLGPADEVVTTVMEHHSNIVPWQLLCERTGATLRWFDVTESGRLDLAQAHADGLLNERTKIVTAAWVSNVLGTVNPVIELAARAHAVGAVFVLDASQGVPQLPTAVRDLGADLVAFTGHKMVGPTGIGVLWGRYDLLEKLPPFLGGGEMIEIVEMERSTFAPPPARFEAGTPPIAQAVGLGAAADYLSALGMDNVAAHERAITAYALERLNAIDGLRILGPNEIADRGGAIAFTLATPDGAEVHPHDLMQFLDSRGVAVRGGHHCARPLHKRFGVQSSTRASFYLYTTPDEIDRLADSLIYTRDFFTRGAA
ncbi:cysteine desulfurase [Propioniciclava tarda]|uniref:cysteine desulfurase n=1 Tax=Propioniciclava tarda TaxID=433330 RepID=A0A4Q9KLD6_PROTD|nr:cysteine desulfurase [Propioniciclava tarda]TBT95288.1 cysteine desulfurase [Propioniciclava tarda]SMO60245.1 cysteine desulfurase / selenocysteine lyase [Propioniciclava tarda]